MLRQIKSNKFHQKSRNTKRHQWTKRRNKQVLKEIGISGVFCIGAVAVYLYNHEEAFFAKAEDEVYEGLVFIGVDGGGTKTTVVLVDALGSILAQCELGSSNWNSVGEEVARGVLEEGIGMVLERAGVGSGRVSGIWLAMSGVDREQDKVKVKQWIQQVLPETSIEVSNDAFNALASGTEGVLESSLVLISGTGSICVGFNADGKAIRSGGWGPTIHDNASGHYLGSELLKAISIHADGGEKTLLYDLFMTKFGFTDPGEIITWTYSGKEWSDIAALGVLVYQAALSGDLVADRILNNTVENIENLITLTVSKMDKCDTIVLSGGNLTHDSSILTARLKEKLKEKYPQTKIRLPNMDPAVASALLAKNRLD